MGLANFIRKQKNAIFARRLLKNPKLFREFIYTPAKVALKELEIRRGDQNLERLILKELKNDVPLALLGVPRGVLFRQLASPNYETRRFIDKVDKLKDIKPLFWEYKKDKFTNQNEYKHSLGKILFFHGKGKKGGLKINRHTIIDFNTSNGEKICDVRTRNGEGLIEFHHNLFEETYKKLPENYFYDASAWFAKHGKNAKNYYEAFLMLFIYHGILFENFLLTEKEIIFTKEIFIPAFITVYQKTGLKPLIIMLEPESTEESPLWTAHPAKSELRVKERMMRAVVS